MQLRTMHRLSNPMIIYHEFYIDPEVSHVYYSVFSVQFPFVESCSCTVVLKLRYTPKPKAIVH